MKETALLAFDWNFLGLLPCMQDYSKCFSAQSPAYVKMYQKRFSKGCGFVGEQNCFQEMYHY